jgi:hypothetical protein
MPEVLEIILLFILYMVILLIPRLNGQVFLKMPGFWEILIVIVGVKKQANK